MNGTVALTIVLGELNKLLASYVDSQRSRPNITNICYLLLSVV